MFQKLINLFKRSKVIHVLLFLMVLSLFCCGYIVWDSKQAAVWSAVTKTCTGEGAIEAAAYTDDVGLHPIVYLQGWWIKVASSVAGIFYNPWGLVAGRCFASRISGLHDRRSGYN